MGGVAGIALLTSLAKATGGVLLLFLGWVTVERAWRRVFGVSDEERNTAEGCGTCTCTQRCNDERGVADAGRCTAGRPGAAGEPRAVRLREG